MVALSARWPFTRPAADQPATRPDRLLRDNPVLLLSALQAPETVARLVTAWSPGHETETVPRQTPAADAADARDAANPRDTSDARDAATRQTAAPPTPLTEAIRWHGPLRLTPMLRADAGLPATGPAASLGLAYVAETRRARIKIHDSRQAALLRHHYPQGLPTGPEADAWHLVRGLAKRLRGVARLPGGPLHAPHEHPPLPGDADHAVFGHEMLPWIVLREILRPIAPDLTREIVPDGGGYILRHRGLLEIRVRPLGPRPGAEARPGAVTGPQPHLPHALRPRADEAWPRSIYEFCDASVPPPSPTAHRPPNTPPNAPPNTPAATATRAAAALIAEVTGGVHLDADGFPQETRTFTTR